MFLLEVREVRGKELATVVPLETHVESVVWAWTCLSKQCPFLRSFPENCAEIALGTSGFLHRDSE